MTASDFRAITEDHGYYGRERGRSNSLILALLPCLVLGSCFHGEREILGR